MSQQLIELDQRGVEEAGRFIASYLPGLDVALTPITPRSALLPETTLRALDLQYGSAASATVLLNAGVVGRRRIDDMEALDLLLRRDAVSLPARSAPVSAAEGWHLDEVQARAAWAQWGGPLQIDWSGVSVGQIDTGYTVHPVFGTAPGTWIDVAAGRTFFAPGAGTGGAGPGGGLDPLEDQMDGHGTRIGSVICGHDPAAPHGGYFGVAPKVPLIPVRIANHVLISHAQRELAQAIDHLVQTGVAVINLSMGFLPRFQMGALDRAIDRAYEAGVILVCAAGQPLSSVISPAHGRRTIAVAGSTVGHIPWGKSAHGSAVDWAAPAEFIYRAQASETGVANYAANGDGTSYATAITSGAAALWLARHRASVDALYPQKWQRVEAFKFVAKASARPMPHQQPGSFGAGVLDIDALLRQPLPPPGSLTSERPA
jgi:hypothetical protein